jgi:hypothetical protein
MYIDNNKGQSFLEYTLVTICIVASLLGMQYYIKRSIQGRLRESADAIGEQYAPRHTSSTITITHTGTSEIETTEVEREGEFGLETTIKTDETTRRTGNENLDSFEESLYD